jgi:hypothetical protein
MAALMDCTSVDQKAADLADYSVENSDALMDMMKETSLDWTRGHLMEVT